jgi:hypothetical protein
MRIGAAKESTETTASSESDIGTRDYAKGSSFSQLGKANVAREAKLSYRTLQYWLERYRTSWLAELARKARIDRGSLWRWQSV